MKKITFIIALHFMFFASLAPADVIHGTITVEEADGEKENEKPDSINQTAVVRIRCGDETKSTTINIPGTYRLQMNNEGACTLTLSYKQQTIRFNDIISADEPVRFNFAILEQENGKYSLEQR